MAWALLVIGTVSAVELVLRLPVLETARGLFGIADRARRTIRSRRISDHWKEKALLAYAGRLFAASLRVAGLMLVAVLPFALLAALAAWAGIGLVERLTRLSGILASLLVAAAYVGLRRRWRDV